ncbi:MAG: Multifunctional pyrimidine synthesis protein CAD [Chaenotheca gracillima]|nr:MAG: Multifunctional pyrimidine synthesis protein CAD [Chaenotheca gracillima]
MSGEVESINRDARSALILYGSEYGNAQDAAEELGRMVERLHILVRVTEMDSVETSALSSYDLVTFVTSTTGQGDIPTNGQRLWKSLLRRRLPPDYLSGVKFTTFGLGDSSYPKFNWAVRKIHKRLVQLGANEVYPRGEADEQHEEGIDGSFLPWCVDYRRRLLEVFPLPAGKTPIPDDVLLPPKWTLEVVNAARPDELSSETQQFCNAAKLSRPDKSWEETSLEPSSALTNGKPRPNHPAGEPLTATLAKNQRVTPHGHWQDVRHLTFTTQELLDYTAGDVLTIFPQNFPEDVDALISLMDWTSIADELIELVPALSDIPLHSYPPPPLSNLPPGSKTTLRELLTKHLDITAIPRRSFFAMIAHFTSDTMHKERLLEFTNPIYVDELYDYTTRPRRSIMEVLQEFESVKIPWRWAANVLPLLRGRQFSIASGGSLKSPSTDGRGTTIELLVAIVKYRTVIKKIRQGVCTRYLASLPAGAKLDVRLQKGGLNISKRDKRPAILIGPGTGVAPIRSLLWERRAWKDELHKERLSSPENGDLDPWGKSVLFYGCRNEEADFFFRDEWENLKGKIDLDVFAAFSRDQKQKVYVQDLIRQQSALVYELLENQSGIVYICGGASSSGKMPQAIREALIEVFQTQGTLSREEAEGRLLHMEKEGRYKQETW